MCTETGAGALSDPCEEIPGMQGMDASTRDGKVTDGRITCSIEQERITPDYLHDRAGRKGCFELLTTTRAVYRELPRRQLLAELRVHWRVTWARDPCGTESAEVRISQHRQTELVSLIILSAFITAVNLRNYPICTGLTASVPPPKTRSST